MGLSRVPQRAQPCHNLLQDNRTSPFFLWFNDGWTADKITGILLSSPFLESGPEGGVNTMREWAHSFPAEIIVCEPDGMILEMNQKAIDLYQKEGGAALVGKNVFDHHQEPSRTIVKRLVSQRETSIYTTENGGEKKLVCIAPWFIEAKYSGFVLMVLDLPAQIHKIIKD